METDGQEGLKNKTEKQYLPEGLENLLRNRHKGQAASGEEEAAPKRTPKAGRVHRRDYPVRGGRPSLHENLESGAQDDPTGKGTKTRVEERQHRRDRRQDTVEQPRGRREAERRAHMEVSGSSTPKPQGTVKT